MEIIPLSREAKAIFKYIKHLLNSYVISTHLVLSISPLKEMPTK